MGTGKSWAALKIGEAVDPTFSIKKVCFKPSEFLAALEEVERSGKSGQVIVLDESELAAPSSKWQSVSNQSIAQSMMTVRNLRCLIICVTPTFSFLDKRLRILCDMWCWPIKTVEDGKIKVYLYVNKIKTDLLGEKMFFARMRFYDKEHKRVVIVKRFQVQKPTKELTTVYEEKADAFKKESRAKLYKKALEAESDEFEEKGEQNFREEVNRILDNVRIKEVLAEQHKINAGLIQFEFPSIGAMKANRLSSIINQFHKRKGGRPKE